MQTRNMDIIRVLHNKLGISNDTWVTSSVISSWNRDVLSQIKNCFPDLQTQVKMKVLLAFFHIPRRMVEEVRCVGKGLDDRRGQY